jgi:hypothetical protein
MDAFLIPSPSPSPKKVKIIVRTKAVVVAEEGTTTTPEYSAEMLAYISQLDATQRKAFEIAKEHLKTSFNPYLSNGFKEWKEKL